MSKYMIIDYETENHKKYKRLANPFIKENWVVYRGWKIQGDKKCSMSHHPVKKRKSFLKISKNVNLLVGFNIKFDLLYEWDSPELKKFFKRGGKIWCCQYVEYLLEAQQQHAQMCSMTHLHNEGFLRQRIFLNCGETHDVFFSCSGHCEHPKFTFCYDK